MQFFAVASFCMSFFAWYCLGGAWRVHVGLHGAVLVRVGARLLAFGAGFGAAALVLVFSPFVLRFVRGHVILLFTLVWARLCVAA
jgi:hypothetical protein